VRSVGRRTQIVDNLQKTIDVARACYLDCPAQGDTAPAGQRRPGCATGESHAVRHGADTLAGETGWLRGGAKNHKQPCRRRAARFSFKEEVRMFNRRLTAFAAGLCLALASGLAMAQKTSLTVYTALETDQLKAYQTAFEKANPDISITWVRDSTGIITARLLAEKESPKADVVMGVAATSMAIFDSEGMLQPYAPKGLERVVAQYRDPKNPPAWVGMDVWGATICFNTAEAAKRNIPKPETWKDLTKPVYKGQIVMPHPASSGTGFFDVSAWLQLWGEADGWKFMDGLHENIAQYMHSGSRPCASAAAGEYVVGISFEYRANREKAQGKPIDLVFPKEGLGWDLEAIGIHKGTKNMAAAQKLLDWAISDEAMGLYANNFAIVAVPALNKKLPNVPDDYGSRLVKNDFAWAAKNRERILAEWSKRYESKAAAK
jgi:iron(III) transport system substrate-binding protein